ncbi:uncharacterized protein LOC122503107 [Leptopilina heterotoma]|uniref:uncharacterized protein LOC122503107 n=1 Tax=Leptopilina heterotoma TaxID=63436 RepID=UPI001CA8C8C5|nr:uncharacterized protein LOC122503107 [Leptopilina heterotoma]
MIKINLKRSAKHWRITLFFLGFLGSLELIGSAPVNPERAKENTTSLSLKRRSLGQDFDSPLNLAWQAWLLQSSQPGSETDQNSSTANRRITPKSVFIAPQLELEPCADGYKADSMGRCQKIVNIDQEAYDNFLLQQLNKLLGKGTSSETSSNEKKQSSGPIQVNIPLLLETNKGESNSQEEEIEIPLEAIPLETKKEESFIDYNVRNETNIPPEEEDHEDSLFLDSNFTIQKDKESPALVVPVATFNDEANETFSDIVDYKIPLGVQNISNPQDDRKDSKEGSPQTEDSWTDEENSTKDEYFTKEEYPTTVSTRLEEEEESTTLARDTRIENMTERPIRKEIINDHVLDIDSEMETWKNESDASPIQGTKKNETIDADVVYEEEFEPDLEDQEYLDTTQVSEEESEDEILKHGETGMTIPIENQALIRSGKKKKKKTKTTTTTTQVPKDDYLMETTTFFNIESDSAPTTERAEDLESNFSSEVSINKDFIVETTLLDVNSEKVKNSTEPVSANSTASQQNHDDDDDLKALFESEKKLITEPEVVFSPQDNRGSNIYGRKRDGQLLKTNFQSIKDSHNLTTTEPPVVSKPFPHSARLRDPVASPIEQVPEEQEANFHSKRILPLNIESKFPLQSANLDPKPNFGRPTANRNQNKNFVKFPSNERTRPGYVRFPSDDVNSIHSPEFKDRFTFSREEYPNTSGGTKNQFNQKQLGWRFPPATQTNQNPMLLRFWKRMPLLRDPSLDPRYPSAPEKEATSRSSRISPSRRINFYTEKSPHEVKRVLSQNMRSPIGV